MRWSGLAGLSSAGRVALRRWDIGALKRGLGCPDAAGRAFGSAGRYFAAGL